ncbi:MAG: hypothetical protein J0L88_10125 [Xanthomonadales bacterium]|nr:hypothetical protein [Xanthomonadales bacterium]
MIKKLPVTMAALALTATAFTSQSALAAIVCNTTAITIPNNIDGVYVNFVTNAAGVPAPTGWDFNPYNNNAGLQFYAPANGGYVGSPTGAAAGGDAYVLAPGTPIGPSSVFSGVNQVDATAFRDGGTLLVGLRFPNESNGNAIHYGWAELQTTAGTGFPATINRYCWENVAATAIPAGTTPVSLQSYSVD